MSKNCMSTINVNASKKVQYCKIESIFSENDKSFQELMEESFSQTLKSKLTANSVGYLPAV